MKRARQGARLAAAAGKLALRWPDPRTIFKGPMDGEKRAAWSDALDLDEVKFTGKIYQATINDVLVAIVAGALGRYTEYRGASAEDLKIRSYIPVNLRPVALDEKLGNKFGLLFLSLPLGIDDPVERLQKVKQNMDALKESAEAVVSYGIINLLGAGPAWIEAMAIHFFDTKGTAVMTNVPGPRSSLCLAGAPIGTIMAWVPQAGQVSLGFSIISYNGKVWLGVAADKALIPDPETIVSMFQDEYYALIGRARQDQIERRKEMEALLSLLEKANRTVDKLLARQGEAGKPDSNPG
jgi:WS/DGAT/MGAT family acyltransferase